MRTVAIVLGVVILGAIAVFFSGLIKFDGAVEQAAAAPCLTDDAIDPAVRTAANDAARAFYDKLLKGDATAARRRCPTRRRNSSPPKCSTR